MADLPELADMVMELLFDQMKVYSVNYELLHEYAVQTGSLGAMSVLVRKFEGFCPMSERERMMVIMKERGRPVDRCES